MIFQMLIGIINSAFVGHYLTTPEVGGCGSHEAFLTFVSDSPDSPDSHERGGRVWNCCSLMPQA